MPSLQYPHGIAEISQAAEATNDTVSYVFFEIFERTGANEYKLHGDISLYMPESMENPTQITWDGQAMGAGVGGSSGVGGAASDRGTQYASEIWENLKAKATGGSPATRQDVTAHQTQAIVNPYLKMLFRGVNFRNFEFIFRFTPLEAKESEVIFQICQEFRAAALPEEEKGGYKWKYPREIGISYKYQGKDPHPWLNEFKRCVITDIHVNYTSAGHYVSMRNGFPAQIELRLQFSEIELLTRSDIKTTAGPSF